MNKYKILIFDLDDTLIDNLENVKYAFKLMVKSKNEEYNEENFKRWYKIDKKFWEDWQDGKIIMPEYFRNETDKKSDKFLNWVRSQRVLIYFNNQISLDEAISLNNIYMNALKENVISIDGAYDTLNYLSSKGYYIIIATNGPKIATKEKLLKINCIDFVNEVLSADMFGYMKPKKEFFYGIEKTLNNYNTNEYLIIGDSLKSDVGFAMKCNFDSCWFNKNNDNISDEYRPNMVINNLRELIEIL